jgi:hypothetical protein
MPSQQIIVGNIGQGLTTNPLSFNIDNDAFPILQNAYQWRGRIKRKRGTSLLGRLQRYFNSSSTSYNSGSTTISFDGSGNANLITGWSLQTNANIVPGSVTIVGSVGPVTYTDPTKDGYLTPTGTGGPNTINYATGAILIPAQAGGTATATFLYNPDLPVMGLEDLVLSANEFPGTLAFDTVYSYNISTSAPYNIYDVSFYKNPITASYVGYTHKTNVTPTTWNGQDYQQFWTVNYEGALWATNGINVPFSVTNIGMQFKPIVAVTVSAGGPPAIVNLNIVAHGLVVGDFLFINEVATTTGINFQTGYVTVVVDANNVTVEFPNATIAMNGTGGIAQYLTNRSDTTKDCLRWYDGDPTNGNSTSPVLNGNLGWVNFAPPLSNLSYSIDDEPALQYYLVGARMIVPYKDRLLFIGPVIQTSSAGSQIYLQDTVIYSQNGTPYYTASYTNSPNPAKDTPTSPTNIFNPILVPTGETAQPGAWFEDVTGLGGNISAGFAQPIVTASFNEDVLILGFTNRQMRFVYSGNDIIPFNLFTINSELGSGSTFSAVTLDRGAITIGNRGIIQTAQVGAQRIDLQIPDSVFQFNLTNNGVERVTAQRDFISEWMYFTYPSNMVVYKFPNQTLQYNYRDATWAIFNECYTTYGQFQKLTGYVWSNIGNIFPIWRSWNDPWNAGSSTLLQPQVIAGNQQGFIVFRDDGTNESNSLFITSFSGSVVTSPNHCLNNGDYIVISGALGTIGAAVNGNIFSVNAATTNTFVLNPGIGAGTYFGGGVIKRMYIPKIMTKQFPVAWGMARKTRIGPQQYLFTRTDNGQIELQIFLSQNEDQPYNFGPVVPADNSLNNSLIYTDVLYTAPESTNLGLTAANVNLNLITAGQQDQIWHRMNTSLLGDTVQIGFTMNDAQMRDTTFSNQFSEIELHSFILNVSPSQVLA